MISRTPGDDDDSPHDRSDVIVPLKRKSSSCACSGDHRQFPATEDKASISEEDVVSESRSTATTPDASDGKEETGVAFRNQPRLWQDCLPASEASTPTRPSPSDGLNLSGLGVADLARCPTECVAPHVNRPLAWVDLSAEGASAFLPSHLRSSSNPRSGPSTGLAGVFSSLSSPPDTSLHPSFPCHRSPKRARLSKTNTREARTSDRKRVLNSTPSSVAPPLSSLSHPHHPPPRRTFRRAQRSRAYSLPPELERYPSMSPTTPTTPSHTRSPLSTSRAASSPPSQVPQSRVPDSMKNHSMEMSPSNTSASPAGIPAGSRSQPHHDRHHHHRHLRPDHSLSVHGHPLSLNVQLESPFPSPSCSASSSSSTSLYFTAIPPHESQPPVIPPQYPLITCDTLKELDLEVTLRSPQLRHDLLFDPGLQFRPTSCRRKREQTERYWEAVARELEYDCKCTSFDKQNRVYSCVCGKMPSSSLSRSFEPTPAHLHPAWHPVALSTTSRILPLLETLKDVLQLVIHPSPQPTSLAAFDPHLIAQEIEHAVFDYGSVFRWVGDILKLHCAPMRDAMVETMIQVGTLDGEPVRALRMCFDILEIMKLDIANHQLQALRPYLLETSSDFEMRTFQERFEKGITTLHVTRNWVSRSVAAALAEHHPNPSISPSPVPPRRKLISDALCIGMVDLVFGSTFHSHPSASKSGPAAFPETLYLDHGRLGLYVNDGSDLVGLYMLLMLFQQCAGVPLSESDIDQIKRELWEVGPSRLGLCFDAVARPSSAAHWDQGMVAVDLQLARRVDEAKGKRTPPPFGMQANENGLSMPDSSTLHLIENWRKSHYRKDAPLQSLMKRRLRSAVLEVVKRQVASYENQPTGGALPQTEASPSLASRMPLRRLTSYGTQSQVQKKPTSNLSSPGAGLEALAPEISHLGERIARLVVFHSKVYSKLYEVDGFVDNNP